jgi:hypothetical protein
MVVKTDIAGADRDGRRCCADRNLAGLPAPHFVIREVGFAPFVSNRNPWTGMRRGHHG